jgi:hypothetical protein
MRSVSLNYAILERNQLSDNGIPRRRRGGRGFPPRARLLRNDRGFFAVDGTTVPLVDC